MPSSIPTARWSSACVGQQRKHSRICMVTLLLPSLCTDMWQTAMDATGKTAHAVLSHAGFCSSQRL